MSDLLRVKDLSVTDVRNGEVIVNKLSFALRENSCLGIVGESGSGKSMTAKAVLNLLNPWLKTTGSALFTQNGCETELIGLEESRLRHIRGQAVCMILQPDELCLTAVLRKQGGSGGFKPGV